MLPRRSTTIREITLEALLRFAYEQRPSYSDGGTDIEIFDPDEEEWNLLRATSYSPPLLIGKLEDETIVVLRVRFAEPVAKEYLAHLVEGEFGDELHHEDRMNRGRVVAFADARYTSVEDLLGTDDPIDIGRETGVDRDIVSSIATKTHRRAFPPTR